MIVIVILSLGAALLGAIVGALLVRQLPRRDDAQADAERRATVQAAIEAVRHEREATVQAAVSTVVDVAGDRLGHQVDAGNRELDLRNAQITQRVDGMNDELRQVRALVARLQQEKAEQHGQLVRRLEESIRSNGELTSVTDRLREALAGPKARGSWGERMAEDVLRTAGFVEGVNYVTQTAVGTGGVPDLTFLLPDDRVLHMDVKFPIDNYLRHLDAEADTERAAAAAAFVKDVKTQVRDLAGRDYTSDDASVDYLVMFVPNEAVYTFLHQQEPGMIDHALSRGIVLCSPLTLFPLLSVIRQATETLAVERTSGQILDCLVGFTEQWRKFTAQLEKVERSLTGTNRAFEDLSGTRRRALERRMAEIDDLRSRPVHGEAGADPEGVARIPDRRVG